ncbi:MAM and LDL-receptor class A domain-containing protein 1-like [Meleagris gallopavo]|uniref:MAM and LDL-receptor class A domain-containing protein 1-like n=1 Tax=Meleagris gallopavo TaxID=9103 RepID=UPI0005499CB9|nr:MAM and LDL-receptor class A domain-containing protein 1-like [Meleagris gallopavo]
MLLKTSGVIQENRKTSGKAKTITVNSTENFEVIFRGMVENQRQNVTVAIDDVSFSEGCSLASALQTSNFELGMCEWNSDQPVVPALWAQLQSGHKIASCSSVKYHSNDTKGHLVCLEANDNVLYRNAYLNSSMCHCSSKSCHFQFQYSMADNSVLKAVLYTNQEEYVLWENNITTNKEWAKAYIRVPTGLEKLKLTLKGTIQSRTGFICLNNIQFLEIARSESSAFNSVEEFACTNGKSTEPGSSCVFYPDCSDSNDEDPGACSNYTVCNFDTDFCGWKILSTSDTKWNIMKEGSPFDSRLPERDQATKSGHETFIYFSGSYQMHTEIAMSDLGSPFLVKLSPGYSCCQVTFGRLPAPTFVSYQSPDVLKCYFSCF